MEQLGVGATEVDIRALCLQQMQVLGHHPFGIDVTDVRRRLLEFNNRIFDQDIDTFHAVAGVDGTFPELKGWYWDVSLNYGRTQASNLKTGNLRLPKLQAALGPTWRDSTGALHCGKDSANNIPNCVPLDLFHGPGSITPDQIEGLTYTGNQRGFNQRGFSQRGLQLRMPGRNETPGSAPTK